MSDCALITGATKGIGRATALALADAGLKIIATGRNVPELDSLKNEIINNGGNCLTFPADVLNEPDLNNLIRFIADSGDKLALLVHCAGLVKVGTIETMNPDGWQEVLHTNLTAPFFLTRKCIPRMKKNSLVVFINSVAGKNPFAEWSAYCASKYGLRALADVLRQEVSKKRIRVTTIYPASVDTSMQEALPYNWDRSKMLQPEDVARAVVYCFEQPENVIIKEIDLENPAGIF